jgi:hypothetical protein
MQRPDPARAPYADLFTYLFDRVDEIAEKVDSAVERKSLTIDDLAARYHVSRSSISERPWRMPNFGRADFGEVPRRWWLTTVERWEEVPEADRRERWELMSAKDKQQALGVSA